MKKSSVNNIVTKAVAGVLVASMTVSGSAIQLANSLNDESVTSASGYNVAAEGSTSGADGADAAGANGASDSADGNGVNGSGTDGQNDGDDNLIASTQALAAGTETVQGVGEVKYFPSTMYDYSAEPKNTLTNATEEGEVWGSAYNFALQRWELENTAMTEDSKWNGIYFSYDNLLRQNAVQNEMKEKLNTNWQEHEWIERVTDVADIENGVYILYNIRAGKMVSVGEDTSVRGDQRLQYGTNVLTETENYTEATEWTIIKNEDGTYVIRNAEGVEMTIGKGIGVAGEPTEENLTNAGNVNVSNAITITNHGTEAGAIQLSVTVEETVVDADGTATVTDNTYYLNDYASGDGKNFAGWTLENEKMDAFYLYRVNSEVFTTEVEPEFDDNDDITNLEDGEYVIVSANTPGKALDISDTETDICEQRGAEGPALVKSNMGSYADAMIWTIEKVNDNEYTIKDEEGRYLCITHNPSSGCVTEKANNFNDLTFFIRKHVSSDGREALKIQSTAWGGLCLNDFEDGGPYFKGWGTSDGNALILYKIDKDEKDAHKWNHYARANFAEWNTGTVLTFKDTGLAPTDVPTDDDGNPLEYTMVYDGLVKDKLDANGQIQFNVPQAGLFDDNTEVKNIYKNVGIPFVYESSTGMYTFNSDDISAVFGGDQPESDTNLVVSGTPQWRYKQRDELDELDENRNIIKENGRRDFNESIWAPFNSSYGTAGKEGYYKLNPINKDAGNTEGGFNFHFGMKMSIPFNMTKNGRIKETDDGSAPIKFSFTGDDDVWIFVDDQLVLDLAGIHSPVGGTIDFANNTWSLNDTTYNYSSASTPRKGEIFNKDGVTGKLGQTLETFAADETHTLTIFYLERGAGGSNCHISFNLPMKDFVSVTKKANNSISADGKTITPNTTTEQARIDNIDFGFTLYKKVGESDYIPVANTNYNLIDADGQEATSGSTDANGHFTLRNGQTARFITDIHESGVSYYVVEDATDGFSKTQYTYMGEAADFSIGNTSLSGIGFNRTSALMDNGTNAQGDKVESDKITIRGLTDGVDTLQFVCENYIDGSMPNPSLYPTEDRLVIDYGLGVQIEPLKNDVWRGDSIELTSVEGAKHGTITRDGNVINYQLTEQFNEIEVLTYKANVKGTNGETGEKEGKIYIIPATQMYYEEDFSDLIMFKQGKAENDWQVIGAPETDYQEPGVVGTISDSPYGSDDAYKSDSADSNGSSMYINTDKGAAQFSYTFTGTGTAFLSRMCDTSGYMRVVLRKSLWEVPFDGYGKATIKDTSNADGKGIVFKGFETDYYWGSESKWQGQAQVKNIPVENGKNYRIEVDVKSSNPDKNIILQSLTGQDNESHYEEITVPAGENNGHIELPFTATDVTAQITLAFGAMSESESGTYDIEFSNLKLYKVDGENVTEVPLDEQVEKLFRNTYYKDGTDEKKDVVLYNIPVYNREDLEYGTYSVTVTIAKNFYNGKNNAGEKVYGNEFWLDGIRVYNPLGTGSQVPAEAISAYSTDGEANNTVVTLRDKLIKDVTSTDAEGNLIWKDNGFILFTDTNGEMMSADDYKSIGPKEEVYLNGGQSISFSLANWDANSSKIYLGIKAPFGSGIVNINNQEYVINNAADCYYVINPAIRDVDGKKYADFVVTAAEGSLISITNIKVTGKAQFAIYDVSGAEDVDWSSIDYIASDIPPEAVNQFKVVAASGAVDQIVSIQEFGEATEAGIYVIFKDADVGSITVNGKETNLIYGGGSGRLIYLSNFNKKYNTVVINDTQGLEKAVL